MIRALFGLLAGLIGLSLGLVGSCLGLVISFVVIIVLGALFLPFALPLIIPIFLIVGGLSFFFRSHR